MAQVEEVLCILCQKQFLTKILIPSSTLCSSRARWPMAPNFCSKGNRKSQFSHRLIEIICQAHQISQFQSTGLLSLASFTMANETKRKRFTQPLSVSFKQTFVIWYMYLMFSIMITVCVKEYAKTIEIIFAAKYTA